MEKFASRFSFAIGFLILSLLLLLRSLLNRPHSFAVLFNTCSFSPPCFPVHVACRYCELYKDNGIFASADAAYVLAYSIIMLTTDLHSQNVKRKMTKEDFIKMTRGINDNRDLPVDFVSSIYDDIARQEIRLKGGSAAPKPAAQQLTNARTRQALYHVERKVPPARVCVCVCVCGECECECARVNERMCVYVCVLHSPVDKAEACCLIASHTRNCCALLCAEH